MKPPAVGSVWVKKEKWEHLHAVPVAVIAANEAGVATTHVHGRPGRSYDSLTSFLDVYRPAPAGTPEPVVWPVEAEPVDGALICRLGDVPVGWLYREGWEAPGEWKVRLDDDRSYEGALVECRPPDARDVIFDQPEVHR